jgi:hypothetical protein
MFLTLQHRWRRPRMRENVRRTVESLCREFVTFDIAPPREQKLLKYSEKRVKWVLGIFGWGLLRQRPPFICPGYRIQQFHARNRPASGLLDAESKIGRGTAIPARQ